MPTQAQIDTLIQDVTTASSNPDFRHHTWFVKYHLQIVDTIATELLDYYPEADAALVKVMAWMHDYGKILNYDEQYELTQSKGVDKLLELGFENEFATKVIDYIGILDKKLESDLNEAPIEVKIVSSADGCSHLVGPFMYLWWYENADRPFEELMAGNKKKALKDWDYKIVLPEARAAFEKHHKILLEQSGDIPTTFL